MIVVRPETVEGTFDEMPTEEQYHGSPDQYNWIQWKTKDGQKIRVYQLEDTHILHIEPFLVRNAKNILLNLYEHYWDMEKAEHHYEIFLQVIRYEINKRGLWDILYPEEKPAWV